MNELTDQETLSWGEHPPEQVALGVCGSLHMPGCGVAANVDPARHTYSGNLQGGGTSGHMNRECPALGHVKSTLVTGVGEQFGLSGNREHAGGIARACPKLEHVLHRQRTSGRRPVDVRVGVLQDEEWKVRAKLLAKPWDVLGK